MRSIVDIVVLSVLSASVVGFTAASAEDRYGPPPVGSRDLPPSALLSWPGKVLPTARPDAPQAAASEPASGFYTQPRPWPAPMAANTAAPTAAPGPSTVAGMIGAPPRFYSVHRQYGLQPDPVTLSPQFQADSGSADMAEPPPPPPPHSNSAQTANMSAAAAASQARAANESAQGSDSAAIH